MAMDFPDAIRLIRYHEDHSFISMGFFNSLKVRIPLALIGGILYGLLTYGLLLLVEIPLQAATGMALFVFFLYLGSRFLMLFSGIDTPYYSKERERSLYNHTPFHRTAQWVGQFYHVHDAILFAFLAMLSILFVISLAMDAIGSRPFGQTIQNLWDKLTPPF